MYVATSTARAASLAGHPFVARLSRLMPLGAVELANLERIIESTQLARKRKDVVVVGRSLPRP
jgi:hypothetical protein